MSSPRHASSPAPSTWQPDPTMALGLDWDDVLGDERRAIRTAAKRVLSEALGERATPTAVSTIVDLWLDHMAKRWQATPASARLDQAWGFSAHEIIPGRMTDNGNAPVRASNRRDRTFIVQHAERLLIASLRDAGFSFNDIEPELGAEVIELAPELIREIQALCNDRYSGIEVMVPQMSALLTVVCDRMPGVIPLIGTNGDHEVQTKKIADASARNGGVLDNISIYASGHSNINAAKPDTRMLEMMMVGLPSSIRALAFVDNRRDTGVEAAIGAQNLGQRLGIEVLPVWFDAGGSGLLELSEGERKEIHNSGIAVVRSPAELLSYADQCLEMSREPVMDPTALQQSFSPIGRAPSLL